MTPGGFSEDEIVDRLRRERYESGPYDSYMRVTEKGQVTIPKDLRDELGIGAGTEVVFERDDDAIIVRKASGARTRGRGLAERLRGRGDVPMTTGEIMSLTRDA